MKSYDKFVYQIINFSIRSNKNISLFLLLAAFFIVLFCGVDDQEAINLYLNKLQSLSEHRICKEQKLLVQEFYLNNKNTNPIQKERHIVRREFNSKKAKLKQKWTNKYLLTWPQIKITKKTSVLHIAFEAHHIIPINAGGINQWWNISPISPRNHKLLHDSFEEKACFSHDFFHRKIMRAILKIQVIFSYYCNRYINKKGSTILTTSILQ